MIERGDIEQARRRIASVLRPTPVSKSHSLSEMLGREVLLKPEHLQRTGSFKIRGAYNFLSAAAEQGGAAGAVVAGSAGNHAQGVALAARLCGLHATIFMPEAAPLPKAEATRHYGAEVVLEGETVEDCLGAAHAYADRTGARFVPPFDDPLVVAGQGTIGLELAEQAPDAETVVVPVGGGGLVAGIAAALARTRPATKVFGVEAQGAASMQASLAAGHPVTVQVAPTMADGIAVARPSELTLAHVQAYVDGVLSVGEEDISRAVLLLLERAKAVVEPAGAVGLAALLAGAIPGSGPVVVVLSGGNVDPLLLTKLIDHGLSVLGRYLLVRVVLPDRPGTLARLTAAVAALRLNVLSVEHHRAGLDLGVNEVDVLLTLETRDRGHQAEVVHALSASGFRVEPAS